MNLGNDAPSHVMLFFIISKYLYSKDYSIENFNFFYLYSIFAFFKQSFFHTHFFIPLIFFIKNIKNLKKFNLKYFTYNNSFMVHKKSSRQWLLNISSKSYMHFKSRLTSMNLIEKCKFRGSLVKRLATKKSRFRHGKF